MAATHIAREKESKGLSIFPAPRFFWAGRSTNQFGPTAVSAPISVCLLCGSSGFGFFCQKRSATAVGSGREVGQEENDRRPDRRIVSFSPHEHLLTLAQDPPTSRLTHIIPTQLGAAPRRLVDQLVQQHLTELNERPRPPVIKARNFFTRSRGSGEDG